MRVVFLEDVAGVAQGGDIKEVKNGFARNYLIPQRLATLATREALQRIERLKGQADVKRLQTLTDMRALSEELDGARIQVEMRAGASGRLYGSVTNITVADEIAGLTGREIDRRTVQIPEPIRQVGLHDVSVRLHPEVTASVSVLVYPIGNDPEEFLASWMERQEGEQKEAETETEDLAEVAAQVADAADAAGDSTAEDADDAAAEDTEDAADEPAAEDAEDAADEPAAEEADDAADEPAAEDAEVAADEPAAEDAADVADEPADDADDAKDEPADEGADKGDDSADQRGEDQ